MGADTHPDGRKVLRQTDGRKGVADRGCTETERRSRVHALRDRTREKSTPSQLPSARALRPRGGSAGNGSRT